MPNLKQNTLIYFNLNSTLKGYGKIVGQSMIEQPILGAGYIIKPEKSISNNAYPYSHFVLFENQFTVEPVKEVRRRKLNKINNKLNKLKNKNYDKSRSIN